MEKDYRIVKIKDQNGHFVFATKEIIDFLDFDTERRKNDEKVVKCWVLLKWLKKKTSSFAVVLQQHQNQKHSTSKDPEYRSWWWSPCFCKFHRRRFSRSRFPWRRWGRIRWCRDWQRSRLSSQRWLLKLLSFHCRSLRLLNLRKMCCRVFCR